VNARCFSCSSGLHLCRCALLRMSDNISLDVWLFCWQAIALLRESVCVQLCSKRGTRNVFHFVLFAPRSVRWRERVRRNFWLIGGCFLLVGASLFVIQALSLYQSVLCPIWHFIALCATRAPALAFRVGDWVSQAWLDHLGYIATRNRWY